MELIEKDIFHIHTYRCKHAGKSPDEEYVKVAVSLGASCITFTDHAPFPGDPFDSRMEMSELPGYISSLRSLREKYAGIIDLRIGLEVEYLPGFRSYYQELSEMEGMDILINGQHFFQMPDGQYSFTMNRNRLALIEAEGLGEAICEACHTGLFQVIAHPDRIFRRQFRWTEENEDISKALIKSALDNDVILERNIAAAKKGFVRPQFWKLVPASCRTIVGLDAHQPYDINYILDPPREVLTNVQSKNNGD